MARDVVHLLALFGFLGVATRALNANPSDPSRSSWRANVAPCRIEEASKVVRPRKGKGKITQHIPYPNTLGYGCQGRSFWRATIPPPTRVIWVPPLGLREISIEHARPPCGVSLARGGESGCLPCADDPQLHSARTARDDHGHSTKFRRGHEAHRCGIGGQVALMPSRPGRRQFHRILALSSMLKD